MKSGDALEKAANVAIILTCVAIIGALSYRLFSSPEERRERRPAPPFRVGATLKAIPSDVYSASPRTLVLLLQSSCRFCTDSMPFYRRLIQTRRASGPLAVFAVAVLSSDPADRTSAYLQQHSVDVDHVISVPAATVRDARTPTVLVLNKQGIISYVWVGLLPPEQEREVLRALSGSN